MRYDVHPNALTQSGNYHFSCKKKNAMHVLLVCQLFLSVAFRFGSWVVLVSIANHFSETDRFPGHLYDRGETSIMNHRLFLESTLFTNVGWMAPSPI